MKTKKNARRVYFGIKNGEQKRKLAGQSWKIALNQSADK